MSSKNKNYYKKGKLKQKLKITLDPQGPMILVKDHIVAGGGRVEIVVDQGVPAEVGVEVVIPLHNREILTQPDPLTLHP